MLSIEKISSENFETLQPLYNDFELNAKDYYMFENPPIEFDQIKPYIESQFARGFYATFKEEPIAFLLYVINEHKAIEINVIHVKKDFIEEEIQYELLEALIEESKSLNEWILISYAMLGEQTQYVQKITHYGFKLVGQAVFKFDMNDIISTQIVTKLKLPSLPDGYILDTWKPEYEEGAAKVIFESFKMAPDAKFDPRFRTLEGCQRIVNMIATSIMGDFQPKCTSVLLKNSEVVGICFGNLTNYLTANVPLVGLLKSEQGKGFSAHMLKNTVMNFIFEVIDAKLDCTEINATAETDNFAAIKMYRKVGFKEDYNYPQAYLENTFNNNET